MKPRTLNETAVEASALDCLESLGYASLRGGGIAPEGPQSERASYQDIVLAGRLREALRKLNPALPSEALDEAYRKLTVPQQPSLIANNRAFHRMLVDGITVECRMPSDHRRRGNETHSSKPKSQSLVTSSPTSNDDT